MKYMLLIFSNPRTWDALSAEQRAAIMRGHEKLTRELAESGELVASEGLDWPQYARAVRVRGGTATVTDGPFAEAKEHLAGFFVVDCVSVERATDIAARVPDAEYVGVEVRPVVELPDGG